jgi:hypothetical protein
MGRLSYMRFVVDRNVVMRRTTVFANKATRKQIVEACNRNIKFSRVEVKGMNNYIQRPDDIQYQPYTANYIDVVLPA